jgi:flagellin
MNRENTTKSLAKLSSGLRINNAGDDAAGLAISEKMRSQIRGLDQASRNAKDGQSLLQVAEGALNETHSILQRMKELAVQSANDTNTDFDRTEIQKEIEQLKQEIDRISRDTEFNTMKLLNGTKGATATADPGTKITFTVAGIGMDAGRYLITNAGFGTVTLTAISYSNIGVTGSTISSGAGDVTMTGGNVSVAGTGDIVLMKDTKDSSGALTGIGALYGNYRLDFAKNTSGSYDLTLHGPDGHYQVKSFQTGADKVIFDEIGVQFDLSKMKISDSGYLSFTAQVDTATISLTRPDTTTVNLTLDGYKGGYLNLGGLQFQGSVGLTTSGVQLTLKDDSLTLHIGSNEGQTMKISILDASSKALGINLVDLTTQKLSEVAITSVDSAINKVSSERSKMGAIMNRLDHTVKNLGVTSENLSASESRIRDVDMAKEMMEFTKSSILSQAAQSMLAQANAMPQGILQLLQG